MSKRKRSGFAVHVNVKSNYFRVNDCESFGVHFDVYNDTVVKCTIYDSWTEEEYLGVAKKHKDDVFDLEVGRELAFSRAMHLRDIGYKKAYKEMSLIYARVEVLSYGYLNKKFRKYNTSL